MMINFWPPSDIFLRPAERKESDLGGEQDRDMIGSRRVGALWSFQIWCVTSIWAALYGFTGVGRGPPGGKPTARGGCRRQGRAHIYLPNHGNVVLPFELEEKGDHRWKSVWGVSEECGPRERPRGSDLSLLICIGHL